MEDFLEVYKRPYDPKRPLVCLDESNKQHTREVLDPIPMKPGSGERYDTQYERYERNGVNNLFMMFEPLSGWRHVEVTDRRTAVDWAHQIKFLVDVRHKDAEKIVLVEDNLNTHCPASLYGAFSPQEARRMLDKLEFHYSPKHGSWLDMAEIELSILSQQCLDRRIPDQETLRKEVKAWEDKRNNSNTTMEWRFKTEAIPAILDTLMLEGTLITINEPKSALASICNQWSTENEQHLRPDVSLGEDASKMRGVQPPGSECF